MPSLNSQTAYCCALETLRDGSSNTARHATHDTNARRPTLALETHDTNARRPTLTYETRDTNARLQPPKTGPFTPAKAMAVSVEAQPARAKATPVS